MSGLLAVHGVGLCVCKCNIEKSSCDYYSLQLLVSKNGHEFNCTVMKCTYCVKMSITSVLLTAKCCNINCISILDKSFECIATSYLCAFWQCDCIIKTSIKIIHYLF